MGNCNICYEGQIHGAVKRISVRLKSNACNLPLAVSEKTKNKEMNSKLKLKGLSGIRTELKMMKYAFR